MALYVSTTRAQAGEIAQISASNEPVAPSGADVQVVKQALHASHATLRAWDGCVLH